MLPFIISGFLTLLLPKTSYAQAALSFSCLSQAGPFQTVSGFFNSDKFEPAVEPNKKFDARHATFEYPETFSHAMVSLGNGDNASPGMCWAGGYFTASTSWHDLDISWETSKQGYDDTEDDRGEMNNTSSATSYHDTMTWTGMHVYNMHDAIRTNNTFNNWTIQHSWFEYIRDDCIENDSNYSGTIYDVLFDGCYGGISNQDEASGAGVGQTITIDKALIRMEPMPYPYKWDEKDDPVVYVDGYSIPGTLDPLPFGHGNIFKGDPAYLPEFSINNSVFLMEYDSEKEIFPPTSKIVECSNNTFIWLGDEASAPYYLQDDFPGCFTIITDPTEGIDLWKSLVADWHARHPEVGINRKPADPGEYVWPRFVQNGVTPMPTVIPSPSSTLSPYPTSTSVPGDANEDGVVDGLDYVTWLNNYGNTRNGTAFGDFDNSGFVDGIDYVIWLNHYSS